MSETNTTSVPPPPGPEVPVPGFGLGRDVRGASRTWVVVIAMVLVAAALCVGLGFVIRSVVHFQRQGDALVALLHQQMERKDWDGIYREASSAYRDSISLDKHRALFAGIDRKLGQPMSTKQAGMHYNGNQFGGGGIGATFETRFTLNADATERIDWQRGVLGPYRLVAYDISSARSDRAMNVQLRL